MPNWKKVITSGSAAELSDLTLSGVTQPEIKFNGTSDAGVDFAIRATPEGLDFYEPEDGNKIHMQILDDGGVDAKYGLKINGTSVLTSGRALQNVSGNISMFTNNSGYKTTFRTVTAGGNTLGANETLALSAGSNVSISESGGTVTISSTDTNTDTNTFRTVKANNGESTSTLGSTETLEIKAGTNVSLTESAGVITLSSTDTNTNTQLSTAQVRSKISGTGLISYNSSTGVISTTANNYSLPLGTSSTRGGFKIGYTESGKNYPVELSSEKMYVNVPWTDTNTQLSTSQVRSKFSAGSNVTIEDGVISATDTNTDTNTQNRYSTSVVSSSGIKLRLSGTGHNGSTSDDVKFVGAGATTVSRTDASTITITSTDTNTNTTYSAGTGLSLSGTTFSLSGDTFDNEGTYSKLRAQATTAGDVGLGNVTNESKATMFSSAALTGNPTAPTQTAGNDSTRIATTAFVGTAIDNLIGGAPGTLDTLDEIAAALNDDAALNTTLTNSIATKLPKSGGTMTGAIAMGNNNITGINNLVINDPGPNEGISWNGGNIKIYESPNDLTTNSEGNLQVVYGSTRRFTVDNTGINVNGNANISGTITNATWNGDVIADSYLSTNTAHLSGTQTFTGIKTFNAKITAASTLAAESGIKFTGLAGSTSAKALMIDSDGVVGTRGLSTQAFSNYTLPAGSSSTRGGFKIGYTENGKNYPVEVSSEKMYVNVPWTDTNTNTTYSAGTGLTLTGTTFSLSSTYDNYNGWDLYTDGTSRGRITSGENVNFIGGTNVSLSYSSTNNAITISSTDTNTDTNTFRGIRTTNGDTQTTLGSTETLELKAGTNVSISETGGVVTFSSTDTNTNTTYSAGTGLILAGTTFKHSDTSSQGSSNNSGRTYIQDITLDTFGHVTGLSTATETVVNTDTQLTTEEVRSKFSAGSNVSISEDGVISATDTNTDTNTVTSIRRDNTGTYRTGNINLVGGSNVTISETSTGVFNISSTDTNTDTNTTYLLKAAKYDGGDSDPYLHLDANGGTDDYVQLRGGGATSVTRGSDGQITISSTDTNTNTTYSTATSSTLGLVKIGYTENGKNYPVELSSGKMFVNVPWSDTNTDTNTVTSIRRDNTGTYRTGNINLVGGTNVTISETSAGVFNISSTDTNTTYVGDGVISVSGTKIVHKDSSAQASVNNSGNTVIQDVTLDTYGHVTGLSSKTLSIPSSADIIGEFSAGTGIAITEDGEISSTVTNTNTTYSADGNYGLTLSGTTFRLEDDRRRNSSSTDIKTGNTHDYTWYDADVGIRWYVAGAEDMRLQNGGTLQVDGDVVAYSTTISDERLKDNVTTIENPLDKIKALRGVEYDWNAGSRKGKRDLGLIAQEVEKVIPNIVHEHEQPFLNDDEDDKTLYKTVDYEKMVAVLIEGMKEQQSQIDELKSEINQLKGKV